MQKPDPIYLRCDLYIGNGKHAIFFDPQVINSKAGLNYLLKRKQPVVRYVQGHQQTAHNRSMNASSTEARRVGRSICARFKEKPHKLEKINFLFITARDEQLQLTTIERKQKMERGKKK